MSILLDLPQKLEKELAVEAARQGVSLQEYILSILSSSHPAFQKIQSGADLVAYWEQEGLIGTRPEITDSQQHAREVRQETEKRVRG